MEQIETINGVPVTEDQIEAWVAEAEHGYDTAQLKRRGRGRPGRGSGPSRVIPVRLTAEELAAVDARAMREHKTRSEVMRDALAAHAA
ncbi:MAG: ribbon-helix-helix protein, CopG family [Bifidobacteriaceae bacterium]|nr:ribbon-helix-helix protein, CopG family [Bifidobacteriaceae bacterium]